MGIDWLKIVGKIVVGVGTVALLSAAMALARRPAQIHRPTGAAVLVYNWMFRGLALLGVGLVVSLTVATLLEPRVRVGETLVFASIFLLLTLAFLLETFQVRVVMTSEGVLSWSPWRRRRSLTWSDVTETRYSEICRWFVLVGRDGTKIRVSVYLVGIREFIDAVREHLAPVAYEKATSGFEHVEEWFSH
jgi:hypothetical protein